MRPRRTQRLGYLFYVATPPSHILVYSRANIAPCASIHPIQVAMYTQHETIASLRAATARCSWMILLNV